MVQKITAYEPKADIHSNVNRNLLDPSLRRKGVGRRLVRLVKSWASEKGLTVVRVRCHTGRSAAHRFYKNIGFSLIKEQKVFAIFL